MRTPVARSAHLVALVFVALAASASDAQRVAWTTSVNASPSLAAALHPLTTDASGNVFVLGQSFDGTTVGIVTVKLAPNGDEAWRATLKSSTAASACAIKTDPAGNVYVAASVVHVDGPGMVGANFLTVKYDAGGHELWQQSANVNPFGNAVPYEIAADAHGNIYVTGTSANSVSGGDFFTLKYAPDGTELWRAVTDGGAHLGDQAHAIALDAAGNVYIAGRWYYTADSEGTESAGQLIKYDSAGMLQWRSGIDGGGELGDGVDVATDAAGNVFMAATSTTSSSLFPVPILQLGKFDTDGNRLWSVNATGPSSGSDGEGSRAHALAVDGQGNAYVTGEYWQPLFINTRTTFLTLKYSPSGAEQWRAIDIANLSPYGNTGDFAVGLVINANDDVIVTGQRTYLGPGTTMKHGVGGQENWSVEQPAFTPTAIARGPANSVYVAGTTATGLVVQKIVDDAAPGTAATIPATSRGALLLLALAVMVIAVRRETRRRSTS